MTAINTTYAELKKQFEPVEDIDELAERIAMWGKFFLGDDANPAHNWITNEIPQVHKEIYKALAGDYQYYYITAPRGMGKCCDGNTLVQMSNGTRKKISDIEVGDEVISVDTNLHTVNSHVTGKVFSGHKDILSISTKSGRNIKVSPDHKVFTFDGWKTAQELTKNDRIASPRSLNLQEYKHVYKDKKPEELRFLAYMIAEGSLSSGNTKFTNFDKVIVDDFIYCTKTIGFDVHKLKGGTYNVKGAVDYFKVNGLWGHTAKTKRIPDWIYNTDKMLQRHFIGALWDTDGWFCENNGKIGITLANEMLIDDIRVILLNLGIMSIVKKRENDHAGAWELLVDSECAYKFCDTIPLLLKADKHDMIKSKVRYSLTDVYPNKVKKYYTNVEREFRENNVARVDNQYDITRCKLRNMLKYKDIAEWKTLEDADVFWDKVTSIEYVGEASTFDIEVAKTGNFIANGLIVHNSTVVHLVYILYRVYHRMDPYIVLIEKIDKHAAKVMNNIKREIAHNRKLIDFYGNLKPEKGDREKSWSQHEIRLNNGTYIRAIGMMGDIRGSLDAMYRVTLIIGNDVQSIKHMNEPTTLEKHIDYWEQDVEPAIDHIYGKVRLVGNMLGSGCMMDYITRNPEYEGINFSALVDESGNPSLNGNSIWEDRFTTAWLHNKRDLYQRKNRMHVFWAEYMNIVKDAGKRNLKGYRYHDCSVEYRHGQNLLISDEYTQPIPVYIYHCIDPAFSQALNADYRAGVTMALGRYPDRDYAGKTIYVNAVWILDYQYDHSDPSELVNRALELHRKYHYRGIVIEANGPQAIYDYIGLKALKQDPFVLNNPIDYISVKHISGKKEDRILEQLSMLCKNGQFYIRPSHYELQMEMDQFMTNNAGLHITDAIAMGMRVCDTSMESVETYDSLNYRYRSEQEDDAVIDLSNPLNIFKQIGMYEDE